MHLRNQHSLNLKGSKSWVHVMVVGVCGSWAIANGGEEKRNGLVLSLDL